MNDYGAFTLWLLNTDRKAVACEGDWVGLLDLYTSTWPGRMALMDICCSWEGRVHWGTHRQEIVQGIYSKP